MLDINIICAMYYVHCTWFVIFLYLTKYEMYINTNDKRTLHV